MSDAKLINISEKIDGLKFLSETHRTLHDQRRKTETKVFFTTLSLCVLTVTAKFSSDKFPSLNCSAVRIYGFVLWALSSGYLWKLQEANKTNKLRAQAAEDKIMEALSLPELPKPDKSGWLRQILDWLRQRPDWLWQSGIILLFMIACSSLLLVKPVDVPSTSKDAVGSQPPATNVVAGLKPN